MKNEKTTIFAPATPIGESGITVIRISGNDAFSALSRIFSKKRDIFYRIDFNNTPSHTAHHGYIFDGDELIDEAIVTIFRAPNSFTGEDVAELSIHGGRFVFKKISTLLSGLEFQHAEPGEFSKRAFLNGKMDLTQAEAISDLIRAKTELAYNAAKKQLGGAISLKINELREGLMNCCSLVELELDFSEEGLEIIDKHQLVNRLDKTIQNIENLSNSFQTGRIIKEGINLTITGKPNAGKSSIFNYLLKDSRAIVSEIPGTTRDYIEEPLILGGFVFILIDTAGIRKSEDVIEQKGVEKSYEKLNEADIVVDVIDITEMQDNSGMKTESEENRNTKTLHVYNKSDLVKIYPDRELVVSAITGHNIDKLESLIIEKARDIAKGDLIGEVFITNERHKDLLLKSCEYLVKAKNLVSDKRGNELISIEIREAMNILNEIIGKTTNVDILNNIFSKFCIGK